MTAPKPGGLYALRADALQQHRARPGDGVVDAEATRQATIGGVNADLFTWDEGLPSGMYMEPASSRRRRIQGARRSGSPTTAASRPARDDARHLAGLSQRRPLNGLNQRPGAGGRFALHAGLGPDHPRRLGDGRGHDRPDAARSALHRFDRHRDERETRGRNADPAERSGARRPRHVGRAARLGSTGRAGGDCPPRPQPAMGGRRRCRRRRARHRQEREPVFRAGEQFTSTQLSLRNHGPRSASARTDGSCS